MNIVRIFPMGSQRMLSVILIFSIYGVVSTETVFAQSTPQPTTTGSNSVEFDSTTKEYLFKVDGNTLYKYSINDGPFCYQTGATLFGLKAVSKNGREFLPSNVGGLHAVFGNDTARAWDNYHIRYKRLDVSDDGEVVLTRWRMVYFKNNDDDKNPAPINPTDSIDYTFRFRISGKTLVIHVEVDNQSTNAIAFDLSRCEEAIRPRPVPVPSLTLFSLLYNDSTYTSLFFDWEVTNASRLEPFYPVTISSTSAYYAQIAIYNTMTNGQRHPMQETIYLTVSSDLNEVLPNLPGPIAPMKDLAAGKLVLSYGPPFTWLLNPHCDLHPYNYKYLDSLKNRGIDSLAVIIKQYQRFGFDRGFPVVLPANSFPHCSKHNCYPQNENDNSGTEELLLLRNHVINDLNYSFALHENYMDYYPSAGNGSHGYNESDCAIDQNGNLMRGWQNTSPCGEQAFILKPDKAADYINYWSTQIFNAVQPTWSYLDVHSAYNPSDRVDYTASESAGKFLTVLQCYRDLGRILRGKYNGPVQGEGSSQFLYAGYYDDFEARIKTADNNLYGLKAPLLVDFDLQKIHPKSALHGVGHYYNFFAESAVGDKKDPMSYENMLTYVATEFAYGHGGLITKELSNESSSIDQVILEYQQVLPVYKKISNQIPLEILYTADGGKYWSNASEYIRDHLHWYDSNDSSDFMSQVKVRYPGGITIIVNRHPKRSLDVPSPGKHNHWYAYHANGSVGTGRVSVDSFVLARMNGWVVCDSSMEGNPDQTLLLSPDNGARNISVPITLRWKVSNKATQYTIHIQTSEDDITATTPVPWYTIRNYPAGRIVTWSVTATNDGGKSGPSPPRSFITSPD
jgi:hypothetical protein